MHPSLFDSDPAGETAQRIAARLKAVLDMTGENEPPGFAEDFGQDERDAILWNQTVTVAVLALQDEIIRNLFGWSSPVTLALVKANEVCRRLIYSWGYATWQDIEKEGDPIDGPKNEPLDFPVRVPAETRDVLAWTLRTLAIARDPKVATTAEADPTGEPFDPVAELVAELRSRPKPPKNQIKLILFMAERSDASLAELIADVHGNKIDPESVAANVRRADKLLADSRVPWGLEWGAEGVSRVPRPTNQ